MTRRKLFLNSFGSLLFVTALGTTLARQPVQAQTNNEFAQQIRAQLDILTDSLELDDYRPVLTHIDNVGLNVGESKVWSLSLDSGTEYVIAAVCDNDCQNIDLELLEGEAPVDADREEDAYPMVVGVAGNHEYSAKITMQACAVSPCYSGLRLFQKE